MLETSTSRRTGTEPSLVELDLVSKRHRQRLLAACCAGSSTLGKTGVAAHDVAAGIVAAEDHAAILLAGGLAGGDELALGPVAHHLHRRLAGDHHVGGVVPLAPGAALVDQVPELGEPLGDLAEAVASGLRCSFCRAPRVEIVAAVTDHDGVEEKPFLPRFAALGQRNHAGLLQLGGRIISSKVAGGSTPASAKHLGIVQAALAVDVDRHGVELALSIGRLDDRLRQDLAPVAGLGDPPPCRAGNRCPRSRRTAGRC